MSLNMLKKADNWNAGQCGVNCVLKHFRDGVSILNQLIVIKMHNKALNNAALEKKDFVLKKSSFIAASVFRWLMFLATCIPCNIFVSGGRL